jgi:hypothetical protein
MYRIITVLTIALLTSLSLTAQSQKNTLNWIQGKLPAYLIETHPVSENTTGGRLLASDDTQIDITRDVKKNYFVTFRKKGARVSGYDLRMENVTNIEQKGNELFIVTTNESVRFIGAYNNKPKQTQEIRVASAKMIFHDEEQARQMQRALERLAETCGAKLVKEKLFVD